METQEATVKGQDINLFDFILVVAKRKKMILVGTLISIVLTAVICLVVSPVFQGTTRIMPPDQGGGSSLATALMGQLGGSPGAIAGLPSTTATGDLYVGILQTPGILDPMIERFGLMKLYDTDTIEETRKTILDDILVAETDSKSGIISISIYDRDPKRASEMTNAFAEQLRTLLESISNTDAGKRRIFFEKELKKAHEGLGQAEAALQKFQESSGAIKMDDQASAVFQGIASLKAQIVAKEVQLKVMRTYATPNNPDLKKVDEELQGLKIELRKMEEKEEGVPSDLLISTGQIPTIGTEYIRRMREFKYNETLYELLVKQYEAARLDEARDAAVLQIIHPAVPATKKAKPKVGLVAVLVGGGVFCILICTAFVMEFFERASDDPKNEDRMATLSAQFRKSPKVEDSLS